MSRIKIFSSPLLHFCENTKGIRYFEAPGRGAGTAPRFAEPQGGGLPWYEGGAAGLPPLLAETLLGFAVKAEFPAGAFANRGAIPAPNPSVSSQINGAKRRATCKIFWNESIFRNRGRIFAPGRGPQKRRLSENGEKILRPARSTLDRTRELT